jgi:uncharacterized membrane protein
LLANIAAIKSSTTVIVIAVVTSPQHLSWLYFEATFLAILILIVFVFYFLFLVLFIKKKIQISSGDLVFVF